jgi:hypothetical protein
MWFITGVMMIERNAGRTVSAACRRKPSDDGSDNTSPVMTAIWWKSMSGLYECVRDMVGLVTRITFRKHSVLINSTSWTRLNLGFLRLYHCSWSSGAEPCPSNIVRIFFPVGKMSNLKCVATVRFREDIFCVCSLSHNRRQKRPSQWMT